MRRGGWRSANGGRGLEEGSGLPVVLSAVVQPPPVAYPDAHVRLNVLCTGLIQQLCHQEEG